MDLGAQVLQALLVADAEMLLLVNDDQAEIPKLEALAKHGMGADDDVGRAFGKPRPDLALLGGAHHAREPPDRDRQPGEALEEILMMLAGQQSRRHDDGRLLRIE